MASIKPLTTLVLLTTLLLMHTLADAAPITGRIVQTWIEDSKALDQKIPEKQSYSVGKLHGYLSGLADAMAQTRTFCPPNGLPHKELLVIVEKYLAHDYANRDAPASPRIMQLLRQTFPCSPANKMPPPKREQNT